MTAANDLPDDIGVEYSPDDDTPDTYAGEVKQQHEAELLDLPKVTGVGLGRNAIGDDAIVVYLEEKAAAKNLPKQIDGVDVVVEVTGPIDAY